MSLTVIARGLALLLLAVPGCAVLASPCALAPEGHALNARALQTDLMVSALVCGRRDDYNDFVTRFRGKLATQATLMRHHFERQYGRRGEVQMDRFVTRLANEASRASNADRALYCRATGSLFDGLRGVAGESAFEVMLREPLLAARHGVPACDAPAAGGLSARP